MAADSSTTASPNKPLELAITLPTNPANRIHIHLTLAPASLLLFLTTASIDTGNQPPPTMGSLVHAMPDKYNPSQPLSTPLYVLPTSQDFATRMARLLARKAGRPCYVGASVDLSGAVGGGTVEEEMEAFRAIAGVVGQELEKGG